ncbi:MAG: sulfatase-like hydrolase/transferase [Actinomycetota bacterium]|nr:sulfatase-like hydrolase/transferase [Actinomycetota bacterium]
MAPNILLVVLDAVRRDALEPYGAPVGSTPAIADLARRGTALPHAYAPSSWTLPSHASMFTGLLPRRLGLAQAPAGNPQSARPLLERVADRVLARRLQDAGFATHGWSNNLWVSPFAGFDIGFDSFDYIASDRGERVGALAGGARAQLAWAMEGLRSRSDDGAAVVAQALRSSIGAWSGQPTLWFVNLVECHSPYLPPRPWNDLPPADRARSGIEAGRHLSFEAICLYVAGRHRVPSAALERMRHLYARAAAYMDDWLAGVLGALDARGILEDTIVIVTSDHGENFGEDGLIAHGFSLDQRLIHVPLVLAGPGVKPVAGVFSLAELPRLVADTVGLTDHPWRADELPGGIALAQYDPLGAAEHPLVQQAAHKFDLPQEGVERLTARFSAATDGRHKLVVRNGEERLFDLAGDPDELRPLDPAGANGSLEPLRIALGHPATGAPAVAPRAATPSQVAGRSDAEEIAAIEQQMKLLGYL